MTYGQERFAENNALLTRKLAEKKHLIAVHRGSWGGNVIQNTIAAYTCAFKMGADMVESDVNASTDGVLFSFHDGHEPDLLRLPGQSIKQLSAAEIETHPPYNTTNQPNRKPIDRLGDILEWLPEDKLINIDRAWDIFPKLLKELDRHPAALRQVVLKAPVRGTFHGVPVSEALQALAAHPVKYMFMPICRTLEELKTVLALPEINTVGCEMVATRETDELFQSEAIAYIHEHGLFCWVNAIVVGDADGEALYGGLDDDISLLDNPAKGWGRLFEKKIDILQTDWPAILYAYRREALGVE